ncbi:macoilin-1 [Aethina tumida]|uniref:macoilin-1 n=1 Tax=Aethina tumida TaxID=116153 RepID=UPI00214905C1|nr:macoilin-1 [Aethina tumida]
MKRRNAEIGKMRRPMKRNKITEGFYGSTVLYLKFLIIWVLVILADFILEFRFEFLWPFYLLVRSVYDSFKYQGLAFSVFFVCIALTSDMLCFFFIPVHWLFFAASTYVWVQYVWHTDKGICAPTIILWVLFVYLEAAVRLRDVKHMPGHLDLCRPFAAHCIGYPVVTLGFGFKSYVGYRIRQRKQREVAKENEFYMQLIQQALPVDMNPAIQQQKELQNSNGEGGGNTGGGGGALVLAHQPHHQGHRVHNNRQSHEKNGHIPNGTIANGVQHGSKSHHRKSMDKCKEHDHDHREGRQHKSNHNHSHSNGTAVGAGADDGLSNQHDSSSASDTQPPTTQTASKPTSASTRRARKEQQQDNGHRETLETVQRLEADVKRLRTDLQSSRASEQELRLQVAALTTGEKVSRGELASMQREMDELQQRLQSVQTARAADKQTISGLERRLADERRTRAGLEAQIAQERKTRKQEEARAAQVAAQQQQQQQQQSSRGECTDACRTRRRELETEASEARTAKHWAEEKCAALERENAALAEQLRETDILMSALSAMQEKTAHLENSLSAENRIKLDLFSALGEAKRQLEIRDSANRAQEKEIEELKGKIAQVLAVMPNDTFGGATAGGAPSQSPSVAVTMASRVRLGDGVVPANTPPGSTLDPNATAYTPKNSLITSTEA